MLTPVLGILLFSLNVAAQQAGAAPAADAQTIQMLLRRIDQLEAKVAQLEAARETAGGGTSAPTSAPSSAPRAEQASQSQAQMSEEMQPPEKMDLSKTWLHIRGFSDITLHGSNHARDVPECLIHTCAPTSFSLGQVNLFVTSNISERFRVLSEIVFEADADNVFGVDLERMLLEYSYRDWLKLSAGRYHTSIGYYNTAYHHSTWFQTTTGRPFLFAFEDQGGILPIHNVGVSASGAIPSGRLGLHYVAEVGNGRASRSPLSEPVQNEVDENGHKAVNLALFVRPDAVRGLQAGFSVYRDVLTPAVPGVGLLPASSRRIGETILAAHAVLTRPDFEWLNEALVIRHAPRDVSHVFQTPGFYSQVSKRFGSYRPYVRYEWVNAPDHEPAFPDVGLRSGPSVGIRYDPADSVALKLQYDYTALRRQQAISALALQVGFTF
jgi:hypothetical protein